MTLKSGTGWNTSSVFLREIADCQTARIPSGQPGPGSGARAHSSLWKNKLSYRETPVVPLSTHFSCRPLPLCSFSTLSLSHSLTYSTPPLFSFICHSFSCFSRARFFLIKMSFPPCLCVYQVTGQEHNIRPFTPLTVLLHAAFISAQHILLLCFLDKKMWTSLNFQLEFLQLQNFGSILL